MFYTIYKTTNTINGKFYIGKHQTKVLNDGYMGSGKLLRRALRKYGVENFHKEILHVCESEKQMNALERILVVPDRELNYNLCEGGKGGFGYINSNQEIINKRDQYENKLAGRIAANKVLLEKYGTISIISEKIKSDPTFRKAFSEKVSNGLKRKISLDGHSWTGKKHTEKTKAKMRKPKNVGANNPNYGKMWITDGEKNTLIKTVDFIPEGWYKGRVIKN